MISRHRAPRLVSAVAILLVLHDPLSALDRSFDVLTAGVADVQAAEYLSRLARQREVKTALIDLMDRNRVDALV